MIAFTPAPAKIAPRIERAATRAWGYEAWMMFRHARLTHTRRSTWKQMPSARAVQPGSLRWSRKTWVAFQIASNS